MHMSAENYESKLLSGILAEITPQEQAQTDKQMLLAVEIAEAMKRKGLEKNDLARVMNVKTLVITRWLSGTCNLNSGILKDLDYHLGTRLSVSI